MAIKIQLKKEEIDKARYTKLEFENKAEKLKIQFQQLDKLSGLYSEQSHSRKKVEFHRGMVAQSAKVLLDAQSGLHRIEEKWKHGQASILARSLQEGSACPVCGSEHHPSPKSATDEELPSEADINELKDAVKKSRGR